MMINHLIFRNIRVFFDKTDIIIPALGLTFHRFHKTPMLCMKMISLKKTCKYQILVHRNHNY